ncbi:MAG: Nif11-like leader peptide family natural product precursor, partial [Deltaproteobacteria bacterium]
LPEDHSPEPLKTVEEFIQRLHDDPEFERKTQAYENTDEFMEFIKSEGYDFTLDQLTAKFKQDKGPDKRLAPVKVAGTILQPPDESESERPAKSSPPSETDSPKQPETLHPKFEGSMGGRRRGMKWENFDS